jgi:DNA polymerase
MSARKEMKKQTKIQKEKKEKVHRQAVFIVAYRQINKKILYVLLKRKKHWTGWEFPKGGIEKNENLLKTVKRECFEETGQYPIRINSFNVSGKYKYHKEFEDRPGIMGQAYRLFSARIRSGEIKIDKREHSGYKWLEFNEAVKKLTWPNQKKCLKIVNSYLIKNK